MAAGLNGKSHIALFYNDCYKIIVNSAPVAQVLPKLRVLRGEKEFNSLTKVNTMTDTPTFLIINAIPNPEKMEQVQAYLSQVMPVLVSGGGKPIGRYRVTNQVVGEGGPKMMALLEYPDEKSVTDMINGEAFVALADLRSEAFLQLNLMMGSPM
jgi:uncharacterized protein (DUF1330 family)